jgi:hypothetical protein
MSGEEESFDDIMMLSMNFMVMVAAAYTVFVHAVPRDPALFTQRINWACFNETYGHRKEYQRHLRMPPEDFNFLLELIHPALSCDQIQSLKRGHSPILPEIKLYCTIRWLAGGSYSDIHLFAGISVPSFYRVLWECIDALNNCEELDFYFPQTVEDCMEAAEGFKRISYGDAITNCVSVVDGYTPHVVTPPKARVGNVGSFFSGHKKANCVNVQAGCDSMCRFQYLAVTGPGTIADRDALERCTLGRLIRNLPSNYVCILDAAYNPDTHACPLYYGVDRMNPFCDNFNFYGSQCRIRIEMAFGLMYQKWGILWRPLRVDIDRVKCVMQAIARLHNFCINCRLDHEGKEAFERRAANAVRHAPNSDEYDESAAAETAKLKDFSAICAFRAKMAARVEQLGLKRPGT